ncbi:hypothetical protein CEE36_06280 [candidate division TA06 bacterium B3_TA06]|uniref:Uncharacterized protein n=1 Tax=candidate division TA06 bacterium B3_TA06 TaxID=2012487 RepID=A0A532V6P8_UNCT6|nr:MAG: hypothetical protein CEE36_06280 [candidate division TA06 bacterium B3_TA06]
MAKKTLYGLLKFPVVFSPELLPKDTAFKGEFVFNENLKIIQTPQLIRDSAIPHLFLPLSYWEKDTFKRSSQCIAYTYDWESLESDSKEDPLKKMFMLRAESHEFPMSLPILGIIKHRINLFPSHIIVTEEPEMTPWVVKKIDIPLYEDYGLEPDEFMKLIPSINEVENISILLPEFEKTVQSSKRFSTAIRLFERALFEDLSEIALLLLFSVLESLFNISNEEVSHKLRVRVSSFLEKDFEEKNTIYKNIGDCYRARSALVHGSDVSYEKIQTLHSN